jgi:hypothetical protein
MGSIIPLRVKGQVVRGIDRKKSSLDGGILSRPFEQIEALDQTHRNLYFIDTKGGYLIGFELSERRSPLW